MAKVIAVDYDGSYSSMPELFDCIIDKAQSLGYKVILVTMRYPEEADEGLLAVMGKVEETYFTSRRAKLPYLRIKGIKPDLWIDDSPVWLLHDSK
jgi:hypothetical protein